MQEVSHHGHLIKAYREQAGFTQEELASLIGRSRRTIITLEQGVRIPDVKVRHTLAWALQIPHELLGLSALVLPPSALRSPLHPPPEIGGKHLSRVVYETLRDNVRMRLDLYYLGSALGADQKLNDHIEHLTSLAQHSSLKDRRFLLELLSHNYQLKGMIARDQIDYVTADACFTQASLVAQEAECPELHALSLARQATAELWRNRPDSAFYYCKRFAEGVCEDWVVGVGFGAERRKFTLCYFRGEKELFMDLSLRRILLIAGLVLILVAALLIWSITTARSAGPFQHTSYQSSHMVAFYCLPPPKGC